MLGSSLVDYGDSIEYTGNWAHLMANDERTNRQALENYNAEIRREIQF